jgi:hypothetical protein
MDIVFKSNKVVSSDSSSQTVKSRPCRTGSAENNESVDKFVGRVKKSRKRQSIVELNESIVESQVHMHKLQAETEKLQDVKEIQEIYYYVLMSDLRLPMMKQKWTLIGKYFDCLLLKHYCLKYCQFVYLHNNYKSCKSNCRNNCPLSRFLFLRQKSPCHMTQGMCLQMKATTIFISSSRLNVMWQEMKMF